MRWARSAGWIPEVLESALVVVLRNVRSDVARLLPELGSGTTEPVGPESRRLIDCSPCADLVGTASQPRRVVTLCMPAIRSRVLPTLA